jgi:hypothetical protein
VFDFELSPEEVASRAWLEVRWRIQRGDREWSVARTFRPADEGI